MEGGYPCIGLSRGFEVRRRILRAFVSPNSVHFPLKIIWRFKMPSRVSFSLGVLRWGGFLLQILILWKRGISMIDWCIMCKQNEENVDHLPLHCTMASEICSLVFCLFDIHWVMSLLVMDLLAS